MVFEDKLTVTFVRLTVAIHASRAHGSVAPLDPMHSIGAIFSYIFLDIGMSGNPGISRDLGIPRHPRISQEIEILGCPRISQDVPPADPARSPF